MKTNEITIDKVTAKDSGDNTDQQAETVKVDADQASEQKTQSKGLKQAKEINGPKGLEPTRYGDWESKGRCYDF